MPQSSSPPTSAQASPARRSTWTPGSTSPLAEPLPQPLRPAVFLDRDGTLIEDRNYLSRPDDVALLPGAADAVGWLNRAGVPVIVVTNQSGIGRGYFGEREYEAVADRIDALFREAGARLDACYFCPHAPDSSPACNCRKPRPGLFLRAAREHSIELGNSYFIGDRLRDVLPGVPLGGSGFLIGSAAVAENLEIPASITRVDSVREAAERVLAALGFD
ncbi:MAG: HAD-IIIA family hydrolase [Gemmatimonas sp.]|nr:HAD-IIIA family hydrolase [Gemmatimonas sp.]